MPCRDVEECEVEAWWSALRASPGRRDVRNRLLQHYLPFLRSLAVRQSHRLGGRVSAEELMSDGFTGLVHAVERYDPALGYKFETFAAQRIRGAMLDGMRDRDHVSRIERRRMRSVLTIQQSASAGPLTVEALAGRLGCSLDEAHRLQDQCEATDPPRSLHAPGRGEKDCYAIDVVDDRRADRPTDREQRRETLRALMRGLARRDRLLLILYYYEDLNMREIGALLNLSESRVSQMHTELLARIRRRLAG